MEFAFDLAIVQAIESEAFVEAIDKAWVRLFQRPLVGRPDHQVREERN
jgi:hypothetical protein